MYVARTEHEAGNKVEKKAKWEPVLEPKRGLALANPQQQCHALFS